LKLCTQAAQQRLIFTSLKAKSTMDAIRKMREMNIDAVLFADAIVLIMAQKLVPSLCNHCKEDYHPSQDEYDMLGKFYGDKNFSELGFQYNDNLTLKKAVGCKQCIFTGYSGQIALQEVLERTPELNRLISENAPMEEIHNQALKDGMISLNQDGIYKIMNGDCDFKKIQEAFLPGRF
jgi:type II secretory ATPase GspE/PulE/Tfp pilus assembly ATPase PilB-like protein